MAHFGYLAKRSSGLGASKQQTVDVFTEAVKKFQKLWGLKVTGICLLSTNSGHNIAGQSLESIPVQITKECANRISLVVFEKYVI